MLPVRACCFEGGFHARDLDAHRFQSRFQRFVEPVPVRDESGLTNLAHLFNRSFFRIQTCQRSGRIKRCGFRIGDGSLLGLPHGLVERKCPFYLFVLGGLKTRADASERGVVEQAGVGPLQLLQELGRLLELTQLEHVADGRRGLVGIAQTSMPADAREKQDREQNGRGDGRRQDHPRALDGRRALLPQAFEVSLLDRVGHAPFVAQDGVAQSFQGRGANHARVVERADKLLGVGLVSSIGPVFLVLPLEPVEGIINRAADGTLGCTPRGRQHGQPAVPSDPAANRVGGAERIIQLGFELPEGCPGSLVPKLGIGLLDPLQQSLGRCFAPAQILKLDEQVSDRVGVVPASGGGEFGLDLLEAAPFQVSQVLGPDRVNGILPGKLAQNADPRLQRRTHQGQAAMMSKQVLKRVFLRISLVQKRRRLDVEPGRHGQPEPSGELIPGLAFGKVKDGHRVQQPGLDLRELDRLGPEPLLQQPLTSKQSLIHFGARLRIRRYPPIQPGDSRLIGRLRQRADLIDDLVMVGHLASLSKVLLSGSGISGREGSYPSQIDDGLVVDDECDHKAQFRAIIFGHNFILLVFRIDELDFLPEFFEAFAAIFSPCRMHQFTLEPVDFEPEILQLAALLEDDLPVKVEVDHKLMVGNRELEINPFRDDRCDRYFFESGILSLAQQCLLSLSRENIDSPSTDEQLPRKPCHRALFRPGRFEMSRLDAIRLWANPGKRHGLA